METRPRLSSASSYASSSSLSSYYGCASGVSDVELTNDTYGGLKSRTLFDDVKVILCRHDRKLSKLEDDLTFMVRWLHEKFGFTLKSESISSIPSGLDEHILAEDSVVFSDDEDADIEEASTKETVISEELSHTDDHINRSQGQEPEIVTVSDCDVEEQRETLHPDQNDNNDNTFSTARHPEPNAQMPPHVSTSSFVGATSSSTPLDLKTLAGKSTASAPSTSTSTSMIKDTERINRAPRQTKATNSGNKDGQRPTQCDTCGKFLKDTCTLRQHKQIHLNVRPFTCSEPGCGKSFRRKFHLQTHSLIHQGVKKHQCGYCGRLFLLQKDMVTHERLHTGEKPFQCPVCPKSFNIKSHLTIHLRIHTGEKPYRCEVCLKNFSQANSLRIHKKKVHQPNRQPSTSKESRPKQSKKKSSPAGRKSKSENRTQPTTATPPPPLPAKLPLYRNQGKILNYFVPSLSTSTALSPSITILQQPQPIPSSSHRIEIFEPIGGTRETSQIFVPASSLSLVPTSGASIITAAEILDSSSQISLTRNIIL